LGRQSARCKKRIFSRIGGPFWLTYFQAYITGNAFVILDSADTILQTIYDDDDGVLEAIAIDEASGKIATCTGVHVRIYKPYGQVEDALKVNLLLARLIEPS
jgi:hypothetical protein